MKLKKMLNLIRNSRVNVHCDDSKFIIYDCNYVFTVPKDLLKCKVVAVKPNYTRHYLDVYVINNSRDKHPL